MKDASVMDYMQKDPVTIEHTAPVEEALSVMDEQGIRHLPVLEGGHLIGILSDRDVSEKGAAMTIQGMQVSEVMTPSPYHVSPDAKMTDVLSIMAENKLGCVIVYTHGQVVSGIYTANDAVRDLADLLR